ncbi:MAG: hypothetical protein KA154_15430 [Gemmatimonadaceae bacterium]|nr:hypothetical protein [Gemmatimonadaceae bacterium]
MTHFSRIRVVLAAVGAAAIVACGSDTSKAADTVAVAPPAVRAPAPGDPDCPRTGQWAPCALVDRIVHAGLSFKATGDSMHVAFLPVPGVRYRVAVTDTMLAFFFKDSVSVDKALASLDTTRIAPKTDTTNPWPAMPSVIRSGNLLALYFADSERQIERLRLAITAGAPAPVP